MVWQVRIYKSWLVNRQWRHFPDQRIPSIEVAKLGKYEDVVFKSEIVSIPA